MGQIKNWQLLVAANEVRPKADSLFVRATVAVETDVLPAKEIIDGQALHDSWQSIVKATHPTHGDLHAQTPKIFDPINLDAFLAIRTRAVSSLERWGPNKNGDGFPADELIKSHKGLIAKGFYKEHASHDPANAIGILAHAEWIPSWNDGNYVMAVALIDKELFPYDAEEIRRTLKNQKAGVSIGCIAGTAECSICGNIAHNRNEICGHMLRGSSMCVKGRRGPHGTLSYDICRDLGFYELSYTKAPADRDALSNYVLGFDLNSITAAGDKEPAAEPAAKEPEAEAKAPSISDKPDKETSKLVTPISVNVPDDETLNKLVDSSVNKAFKSRLNKLIKTKIDQELGPVLKQLQIKLKPDIEELVGEKKDDVQTAVSGGGE